MRGRFIAVSIVSACFALVAACSSFGDGDGDEVKPPDPAGDASSDATSDTTAQNDAATDGGDGDGDGASLQRFCLRNVNKDNRACDDFQTGPLLEAPWKTTLTVQDVDPTVAKLDSKLGDDFAHFAIPTLSGTRAAYLQHDFGTIGKGTITFGMTVQVTGFGAEDYVELAQISNGKFGTGVAFDHETLRLYVSNGPMTDILLEARDKHRIVVEASLNSVIARDSKGAQIARLDYTFDGGIPANLHLGVGLYYTSGTTAPGTIDIDDVTIDY